MILVVDYGSQSLQLIVKRVRNLGVHCSIADYDKLSEIDMSQFSGIILSGGPSSVLDDDHPSIDIKILEMGIPILGICYGLQLICKLLGSKLTHLKERELGLIDVDIINSGNILFQGLKSSKMKVWMNHGDAVLEPSDDFEVICSSKASPVCGIAHKTKQIYGLQYHPEMDVNLEGYKALENFVLKICKSNKKWDFKDFISQTVESIREKVQSSEVICALSGGVDSGVLAALLYKAIGNNCKCIIVDHGMMRSNEVAQVKDIFKDHFNVDLIVINAQDRFFNSLKGIIDPEEKRNIIGNLFIEIFEEEAKKIPNARFLAQGTIYPDIRESGSNGKSAKIKTHHNLAIPKDMDLTLLEPLVSMFKDDVRQIGSQIGLPDDFIKRHPFPGPGLGVRVIGEVNKEKVSILRRVDRVFIDNLKERGLYDEIWQAFAVLTNIRSVGIRGDNRSYDYVCALRAVVSQDALTVTPYHFDVGVLNEISTDIINKVPEVSRIVYDVSSKPPATIEWE